MEGGTEPMQTTTEGVVVRKVEREARKVVNSSDVIGGVGSMISVAMPSGERRVVLRRGKQGAEERNDEELELGGGESGSSLLLTRYGQGSRRS